eukprot:CAMPEP_0206272554 /NCGR_PEP_ID=MMETSP0047_2-20121206/34072_1 /ASSEMBLY_ACC=CAM_ASM_000192 /TAXON_ID=195065 /ORGANISM="Chroomonas mesostigmatica_cf, Strain CCMP1168" /LENGTH=67 /DNA_ID=CAMNT_0053701487 /DNA_START=53 /DNA_END=256 /DNA_ORIENTATION=+
MASRPPAMVSSSSNEDYDWLYGNNSQGVRVSTSSLGARPITYPSQQHAPPPDWTRGGGDEQTPEIVL